MVVGMSRKQRVHRKQRFNRARNAQPTMPSIRLHEPDPHPNPDPRPRRILGRKAVLAQNWWDTPETAEGKFGLRPQVSVTCKWVRIAALQTLASWKAAYARARDAFMNGDHAVEFPYGTYQLARQVGVRVADPPQDGRSGLYPSEKPNLRGSTNP